MHCTVLDHILVHLAVAYVSVYMYVCMYRPVCVCIPFNFPPFLLVVIFSIICCNSNKLNQLGLQWAGPSWLPPTKTLCPELYTGI